MTYFQNIQSLADLKKEYRRLAMLHHPDKGGDTALMQQVNTEFGKLFEVWKDKPCVSTAPTGYEHDFQGATAKEYTEYVYNEYRWKGRNYNGQSAPEITELVRAWLKETYPRYTFSVRKDGYSSILIRLMKADFEAFTRESGKVQGDINHYNIQASDSLTDRAKEVMTNVRDFVMSYNFDESDPMTDYFHTNFYLTLGIGSYRQPPPAKSAATPSRTGWNCRRLREKTLLKCSGILKDLHTRLCDRHWARRVSASSRAGSISGK
ncbi:uncharacterized protein BN752_01125 [Alistipes putredinis CAG:67]|nr:uncharacterized protein BN752_01125 [Alistipes putredinis CAG:67]